MAARADNYVNDFIAYLTHERRYSPHTVMAYRRDLDAFTGFITAHRGESVSKNLLKDITEADLQAFLARSMTHKGKAKASLNRTLSTLRSFFRWLAARKGVVNEQVRLVRNLKQPAPVPRALNITDTFRLLDELAPPPNANWKVQRDWALMLTLYGLGLRISEAMALTRADAEHDPLTIHGKGNKQRRLPVPAPVRAAWRTLVAATPAELALTSDGPLFPNARGGELTPRSAQTILARARTGFNLPEHLTPHALRHSFASHLLAEGADLRTVQELLGHTSLATTQRYLDADVQRLLKVHSQAHPLGK